jgi:hypothetical protein
MEANLGRTLCRDCGAITLIAGHEWCEKCTTDNARGIPISVLADAIMAFDIDGVLQAERDGFWKTWHVTKRQLQAAEEEVEIRHKALNRRRNRYRGW